MSVDSLPMPKGVYERTWLQGHQYKTKDVICQECGTTIQAKRKDTLCSNCKTRHTREHWKKMEEKRDLFRRRNQALKRNFDISLEEYTQLLDQQKDQCGICKKSSHECKRALDVDHNHTTGLVRGLLCNQCNQALGLFKDNTEFLKTAIKYLEKSNA